MIDKQYDVLAMSVVNTGCALPVLSSPNGRERKPGGDTSLSPLEEQRCHHALASLLNLAVLLSSYGSLKSSKVASSLCAFIQTYDVINRMFLLHSRDVLRSDWSCNIFAVGTGQV